MPFAGVLFPVERPRITLSFGVTDWPPLYTPDRPHRGVDIAPFPGSAGQPVRAPIAGRITRHGFHSAAGNELVLSGSVPYAFGAMDLSRNYVEFEANEVFHIRLTHFQVTFVATGSKIAAGDKIGLIGQTGSHAAGPHVHMELRKGGYDGGHVVNPMHFFVAAIPGLRSKIVVVGSPPRDW